MHNIISYSLAVLGIPQLVDQQAHVLQARQPAAIVLRRLEVFLLFLPLL